VRSTNGLRHSVSRALVQLGSTALAGLALISGSVALAQTSAPKPSPAQASVAPNSAFNLAAVNALVAKGDAAAAAGNLNEARKYYDQARDLNRGLLGWYRDLSGSFRGLDARIPREMDQKGRESLETLAQINLRLAAVFRRQNQPEVAVPLLVEVVKVMSPASDLGRKAYQTLVEIGFAATPYAAGQVSPAAGS
jgi:tetratricopeptide (TPR) repeat protein